MGTLPTPPDYTERVYAGVLGKMIGVYLGRPFESWSHERILAELGPIQYYVHDRLGVPLIVTDDDLSGTFTFVRALPDHGNRRAITPAEIGQTWLNYIIQGRTTLWWGGLGNSTEHTAFLRLKQGIPPPQSGSSALNSQVVAEQIGAQIFIDGWGMVAPGDPQLAAALAGRAASVSHDGEAIYAAQVIAAMEALAFVEPDLNHLLDRAVALIPPDSTIYRLIADLREWHANEADWVRARAWVGERYGYDKYGGNCHIVPNHALVILALLYGGDSFQRALMIVNSSGWDTDCNSGNVGCLLGIKNGLAGIEDGPDWRGPLADRLYLPSADGGRAISDAVTETLQIVNIGRALAGEEPLAPKGGARLHWELPGSVQGFQRERSSDTGARLHLENQAGPSRHGARSLALHFHYLGPGAVARAATPTFIPPDARHMPGYRLLASPTLYSGQTVRTSLGAASGNQRSVLCRLYVRFYDEADALERLYGPGVVLGPGEWRDLTWQVGATRGGPIAEIGLEISAEARADGSVFLDYLHWDGAPDVELGHPGGSGTSWQDAWVDAIDQLEIHPSEPYRLIQNQGTGLLIQGTRDWRDYRVSAVVTLHLCQAAGIAARVQGLRRYYALLLSAEGVLRLIKMRDDARDLGAVPFVWRPGQVAHLALPVEGTRLTAWADDRLLMQAEDADQPLDAGAVALICAEGRVAVGPVRIQPVPRSMSSNGVGFPQKSGVSPVGR
jgi:ADP-ribosylglycohydrolase